MENEFCMRVGHSQTCSLRPSPECDSTCPMSAAFIRERRVKPACCRE
jgi:hypothetical protein